MDSKRASTKKSRQALGWPHQTLVPVPVVEVRKDAQRRLKVGKERLGALHSQKVNIQSLKYAY
jgi:hypothetical protein